MHWLPGNDVPKFVVAVMDERDRTHAIGKEFGDAFRFSFQAIAAFHGEEGAWFARGLNGLSMFGFPLGFWVAAQGALLAFLLIIVVYVVCMERLEARYQREVQASADTPPEGGPVPQ